MITDIKARVCDNLLLLTMARKSQKKKSCTSEQVNHGHQGESRVIMFSMMAKENKK